MVGYSGYGLFSGCVKPSILNPKLWLTKQAVVGETWLAHSVVGLRHQRTKDTKPTADSRQGNWSFTPSQVYSSSHPLHNWPFGNGRVSGLNFSSHFGNGVLRKVWRCEGIEGEDTVLTGGRTGRQTGLGKEQTKIKRFPYNMVKRHTLEGIIPPP